MEGIISVLIGITCFFLLPDTPTLSGRWLKPGEIRFLNLIHQATRGSKLGELADAEQDKQPFWQVMRQVIMDGKIYLQVLVYCSNSVPNYALKFTMPQIIRNMGFTSTNAQLLTAPPYLLGAFNAVLVSALGDRFSLRSPFILGPQSFVIIAYSVLFVKAANIEDNVPLCYVMVTIACMGIYPIIPGRKRDPMSTIPLADETQLSIPGASTTSLARRSATLVAHTSSLGSVPFLIMTLQTPTNNVQGTCGGIVGS